MPLARLDPIPQFLPQEAGEVEGRMELPHYNMLAEQAEQFLAMRLVAEQVLRELWAVERVELDQLLPGHLSTLEAEVVVVEAPHQQTEAQEVLEQTMEAAEEVVAVALLDLLPVQAAREPMELLWW
jgi:hypothetical protein